MQFACQPFHSSMRPCGNFCRVRRRKPAFSRTCSTAGNFSAGCYSLFWSARLHTSTLWFDNAWELLVKPGHVWFADAATDCLSTCSLESYGPEMSSCVDACSCSQCHSGPSLDLDSMLRPVRKPTAPTAFWELVLALYIPSSF